MHYYQSDEKGLSPWSPSFVKAVYPLALSIENEILDSYHNENKPAETMHYQENFKPRTEKWWLKLKQAMQLSQLNQASYQSNRRAIIIANTFARNLPEQSPDFFHSSLPGQGFPFDNLQDSALWIGTPIYILGTTENKAWSLVLTPDGYITWIKSEHYALVTEAFIQQTQQVSKQLVAITQTETPILNLNQEFLTLSYIGSVFPLVAQSSTHNRILIPIKSEDNSARWIEAIIPNESSDLMPLKASVQNFEKIIQELQSRPYGWGGQFFLNDCSQELKSLFTPFGIWLPRNSFQQSQMGTPVDLSSESEEKRIQILKEKGQPWLTLIYVKGHVMLYTGIENFNQQEVAMTYQNIWGLSPNDKSTRYVIGQSVFLPLLKQYPEQPAAASLANKSTFKLINLNQLPTQAPTTNYFIKQFNANVLN